MSQSKRITERVIQIVAVAAAQAAAMPENALDIARAESGARPDEALGIALAAYRVFRQAILASHEPLIAEARAEWARSQRAEVH